MHTCVFQGIFYVFLNFLKWAWYLCFSIWRYGHVVGFFSCVFTDIFSFVTKPCLIYVQSLYVCVMVPTFTFSLITFTIWSCSDYNASECHWILGTCELQDREHPDARINLWPPSYSFAAFFTFLNFVLLPEVQVLLDKACLEGWECSSMVKSILSMCSPSTKDMHSAVTI